MTPHHPPVSEARGRDELQTTSRVSGRVRILGFIAHGHGQTEHGRRARCQCGPHFHPTTRIFRWALSDKRRSHLTAGCLLIKMCFR